MEREMIVAMDTTILNICPSISTERLALKKALNTLELFICYMYALLNMRTGNIGTVGQMSHHDQHE